MCLTPFVFARLFPTPLATLLCQFRDEQTYYRLRHSNPPESLEVEVDDLESKAGEFGIYDLSGFYKSSLLKEKRCPGLTLLFQLHLRFWEQATWN